MTLVPLRIARIARIAFGLLLVAGALAASPARAQVAAAGASASAAQPAEHRPPMRDIEPVYHAPSPDMLATIRKRGVLRVGVAVSAPAVMHDAQGRLVGFSIDAAHRLADDLGVEVEFVETSWSGIIGDLLERNFDLIQSGLWITVPRALVINYSEPTAVEGVYVIASRAAAANWKTPADLNQPGTKIVVYAGALQERLAARLFPRATLVRVSGDQDHLVPVLDGQADAALVPTFAPAAIVKAAPDRLALPFTQPLSSASIAIGVRKGDPDLLNFLNSWLTVQRDEGWLQERAAYWADPANWVK